MNGSKDRENKKPIGKHVKLCKGCCYKKVRELIDAIQTWTLTECGEKS
jgi:hypothetical protein